VQRKIFAALLIAALWVLFGCTAEPQQTTGTLSSSTVESTAAPIITGWLRDGDKTYYYLPDGTLAAGWTEIDGARYYFADGGVMHIGWLHSENAMYFLGADGILRTGWLETGGKRYYLDPEHNGAAHTGWLETEGLRRYLGADGVMVTGWLEIGEKRYYLDAEGVMQTGWLVLGDDRYYLQTDGHMTRGKAEIEGQTCYFAGNGTQLLLVNPWNYMPADYATTVVSIGGYHRVSEVCYDDLMQMMADCKTAGLSMKVASSYRTHADQVYLYNRKVNYYLSQGYSEADAKKEAATVVAIPGTSEHQLGLALDLVDSSYPHLEKEQENTAVQKWLMANSWRYGFILRYPNEKSHITGIIYEPWHYRYVGKATAEEVFKSGLCLEEYLESLS